MEVFVIGFIALIIGVVLGGILARVISPRAALFTALALFAVAAALLIMGRQAQGWDAIGYGIMAMVLAAPMGVGCGLVGLLAWFGLRRR